jgi:hypothetical protein
MSYDTCLPSCRYNNGAMRRRVLKPLTVLSLLLCVTAVVLWFVSYWAGARVAVTTGIGRLYDAECAWGTLSCSSSATAIRPPGWRVSAGFYPMPAGSRSPGLHLWRFYTYAWRSDFQGRSIALPMWAPALVAALLPLYVALRRRRRAASGKSPERRTEPPPVSPS